MIKKGVATSAGMQWGAACIWLLLLSATAWSQEIQFAEPRVAGKGHVSILTDTENVQAGKTQTIELRFRVDPGFHINSHTPKDELLLPTLWKIDAASGVHVISQIYPKGEPFRLEIGTGETLDVYQGEFRVALQVVAPKGTSELRGALRYQACDHAACYPPKTLPVTVAVTGR